MTTFLAWLAPAVALGLPLCTLARQPAPIAAGAPAAPLSYDSAFSDYKPWTDIQAGDWRQLNDDLNKPAGGSGHGDGAAPAPGAHTRMPGHAVPMDSGARVHEGHQDHQGHQGHQIPGGRP